MPALADDALDQLFRSARSYNGYLDQPVTEGDIHAIYDLVKMAPTSANQQSGRFVWCLSTGAKQKLAGFAGEKNGPKILSAPASVIIAYDREFHEHLPTLFPHADAKSWFTDPAARERHGSLNATMQAAYFILAARSLGFDIGPMTGIDTAGIDGAFFADQPHFHTLMISTLGHGDPASIFGRLPRPGFDQFNRVA